MMILATRILIPATMLALFLPLAPAAVVAADSVDPTGVWMLEIDATALGGDVFEPTLEVKKSGGGYAGVLAISEDMQVDIEEIKLDGNKVAFEGSFEREGQEVNYSYEVNIQGNKLKGAVTIEFGDLSGELTVTGHRIDATGTWHLKIDATPVGGEVYEPIVAISKGANGLKGKVTMQDNEFDIDSIELEGSNLNFSVVIDLGGQEIKLDYATKLDGDKLEGNVEFDIDGQAGELEVTGQRVANVAGTWALKIDASAVTGQVYEPKVNIKAGDDGLEGSMVADDGSEVELQDLELDGSALSFNVDLDIDGQTVSLKYAANISGDSLEGTVEFDAGGQTGTLPVVGRRDNSAAFAGAWNLTIDASAVGGEVYRPKVELTNDENGLGGTITSDNGDEAPIEDVKVEGGALSFKIEIDQDGNQIVLNYKATVSGDKMEGTVEFDFGGQTGELPFTGERE